MQIDWNWVYVSTGIGATVILNGLLLHFWKPWLGSYATEKGKNLARKEDLDLIKREMQIITRAQEEIKSKLAGELWNKQMVWNQRRDLYLNILQGLDTLQSAFSAFEVASAFKRRDLGQPTQQVALTQQLETGTKLRTTTHELGRLATLALLFASSECSLTLREYLATLPTPNPDEKVWDKTQVERLINVTHQLIDMAKADLGIVQ